LPISLEPILRFSFSSPVIFTYEVMKTYNYASVIVALLVTAMSFVGCSEDITNIDNSAELASTSGRVMLFDSLPDIFNNNSAINIPNASGVLITIKAGGVVKTFTTDSSGYWKIDNFPSGMCDLKAEKDGFAPYIIADYSFSSGHYTLNGFQLHRLTKISVNLVQRPFEDYEYKYSFDTLVYDSLGNLHREIRTNSVFFPNGRCVYTSRILDDLGFEAQDVYGVLYFSRSPDIDPLNDDSFVSSSQIMQFDYIEKTINFDITTPLLQKMGFRSGEKVYCSTYAAKQYTINSGYNDPETKKYLRTGLSPNHSAVVSFIVP
jgi:hypothetical protein